MWNLTNGPVLQHTWYVTYTIHVVCDIYNKLIQYHNRRKKGKHGEPFIWVMVWKEQQGPLHQSLLRCVKTVHTIGNYTFIHFMCIHTDIIHLCVLCRKSRRKRLILLKLKTHWHTMKNSSLGEMNCLTRTVKMEMRRTLMRSRKKIKFVQTIAVNWSNYKVTV